MNSEQKVTKRYIISQKELKDKLGLVGDIVKIGQWSGLSPNQEAEKVSKDTEKYYIITAQGADIKEEE
jgi:hypothetical protein